MVLLLGDGVSLLKLTEILIRIGEKKATTG